MSLYTCGTLKPLRRPTTLVFCDKKQLMTMDRTAPGYEVAGSVPYFMDSAREPVLQLVRHPNNSTFKMWKDNKCGVPGIPEHGHATRNCACLESSLGNNMEAGYFFAICIPREYLLPPRSLEPYADGLETLNNTSQRYLNTSLTYVGVLSEINTSIPRLIRRASLAKMERESPMPFKPIGGEINWREKTEGLKATLAQLRRPEMLQYKISLPIPDKNESSGAADWPRFHSKEEQTNVWDIKLAGYVNYVGMDSILNNSIFVNPFWGPFRCPFCEDIVSTSGIQTLLGHLLVEHRKLQESVFTCPVCVGITVASWDSWPEHWETYHVPGQAMAMVLNEMAVNVRFGWGLALIAAITTCNILGAKLDEGEEPDMRTNPWGGYCPRTYRAKTMQARVKEARDKILPEALRSAPQPVQQPPQRQALPKATNYYRRASIGSASFTSTRPGTPTDPGNRRREAEPYDPVLSAPGPSRATAYNMPAYKPAAGNLETPRYEPVTPAHNPMAQIENQIETYEKVYDALQDALDVMPSDGTGGQEMLVDDVDVADGDGGREEAAPEDSEMGDNF